MPITTDFDTFAAEYLSRPIRGSKDIEEPSMFGVIEKMNEELAEVQNQLEQQKLINKKQQETNIEAISEVVFYRDFMDQWYSYCGADEHDFAINIFRSQCRGETLIPVIQNSSDPNEWEEFDLKAVIRMISEIDCPLGKDWLLRQACVEGRPNDWNFSIYNAEDMWNEECQPMIRSIVNSLPFDKNEFIKDFSEIVEGRMAFNIWKCCSRSLKDLLKIIPAYSDPSEGKKILTDIFINNDYTFLKNQRDDRGRFLYDKYIDIMDTDDMVWCFHTPWHDNGGFVVLRHDPSNFA